MENNFNIFRTSQNSVNDINLLEKIEQKSMLSDMIEGIIKPKEKVLLVGASVTSTVYFAAKINEGELSIIENDEKYINNLKTISSEFLNSNYKIITESFDDFKTNPKIIDEYLSQSPSNDFNSYIQLKKIIDEQSKKNPLISSESMDIVILDMTLNRLKAWEIKKTMKEIFRVLKPGGKVIASVMLSDEYINYEIENLYIEHEREVFEWFSEAGFYGMNFITQKNSPVKIYENSEIRTFIVEGFRPKQVVCMDYGDAVIYPGPWKEVYDDDGHKFIRGERMALCHKTYEVMSNAPYSDQFIFVPSYVKVLEEDATKFDCDTPQIRDPKVTKGLKKTIDAKLNTENLDTPCACESYSLEE